VPEQHAKIKDYLESLKSVLPYNLRYHESLKAKNGIALTPIVNDLGKAKPAPDLRVALYSYGHSTYDPKTGTWSIWWHDGRNPGDLDPPVKGRFKDGVGTFYSDDTLRGKPIKVRFTWSGITATAAHWEQAFSGDGGKTWETNWTADFSKIDCKAN